MKHCRPLAAVGGLSISGLWSGLVWSGLIGSIVSSQIKRGRLERLQAQEDDLNARGLLRTHEVDVIRKRSASQRYWRAVPSRTFFMRLNSRLNEGLAIGNNVTLTFFEGHVFANIQEGSSWCKLPRKAFNKHQHDNKHETNRDHKVRATRVHIADQPELL